MRAEHTQYSAGYTGIALGVATLAACATFFKLPTNAAEAPAKASSASVSVQDKASESRALQVKLFLHRQGAERPVTAEGR